MTDRIHDILDEVFAKAHITREHIVNASVTDLNKFLNISDVATSPRWTKLMRELGYTEEIVPNAADRTIITDRIDELKATGGQANLPFERAHIVRGNAVEVTKDGINIFPDEREKRQKKADVEYSLITKPSEEKIVLKTAPVEPIDFVPRSGWVSEIPIFRKTAWRLAAAFSLLVTIKKRKIEDIPVQNIRQFQFTRMRMGEFTKFRDTLKKFILKSPSFISLPDNQDLSVDKICDLAMTVLQTLSGEEYMLCMAMYSAFFVNVGTLDRAKRTLVAIDQDVGSSVRYIDSQDTKNLMTKYAIAPVAVTGGLSTGFNWSIGASDTLSAVLSTTSLLSSYNPIMALSPGYGFGGRSDSTHRMKCFYISAMVGALVEHGSCAIYVPSIDMINYLVAAWKYYFQMPGPRFEIVVAQSDYFKVPKMYQQFVTTVRTMSPIIISSVTQVANESKEKKWESASRENVEKLQKMYQGVDFIAYTPVFGKALFETYRVYRFGSAIGLYAILSNMESISMMEVEKRVPSVIELSSISMSDYYKEYNADYARRAIWPFSAAWTYSKFYGVIVPLPLNVKYQQTHGDVEGTYIIDDWDDRFEEEFMDIPEEDDIDDDDEETGRIPLPVSVSVSDKASPVVRDHPSSAPSVTYNTPSTPTVTTTDVRLKPKITVESKSSVPGGAPSSDIGRREKSSDPPQAMMGAGEDSVPVALHRIATGGADDL